MTEKELADAVEIIPGRLYWVALGTLPKQTAKSHYFSIDNELVYEPFFADFGPLNLGMTYRYCKMLYEKLNEPQMAEQRIVHFCSHDPKKRANAAYLVTAYQVIVRGVEAEAAFAPFQGIHPPFLPFRDATCGICTFHLTIPDCLEGLQKAIQLDWFDWKEFDLEPYEFFEKVDNGDMNWVVPGKFLAFAGPSPTPTDADGFPAYTPEDYVPIFKNAGITMVVRLNKKQYDRRRFIDNGIRHVDLYFLDGSCPSREIMNKFLQIAENEPGALAVHCKAGLGRTGTLIGLYCLKHYMFPSRAFIGWNRVCRPGSFLGAQQQFFVDMQHELFQAGIAFRAGDAAVKEHMLANDVAGTRQLTEEEQAEDTGQGDRLRQARRKAAATHGPSGGGGYVARAQPPPVLGGSFSSTANNFSFIEGDTDEGTDAETVGLARRLSNTLGGIFGFSDRETGIRRSHTN